MNKRKRRYTFGLLIDWIIGWMDTDYYQSLIISSLSDFAKDNDINIMVFVTGRVSAPNDWEKSRNLLFEFVDMKKVDGIIVPTPAIGYSNPEAVLELLRKHTNVPIVTLGEKHPGHHSVTIDNYTSMKKIVEHMIDDHHYERIAFITGPSCMESTQRFKAYCDALREHDILYDPSLVYKGNFLFETGAEAIQFFTQNKIQFDALVCSNDNMAIGALTEFNKINENKNIHLPITGFDDIGHSKLYSLTTIRQSFYDQTKTAAQLLLNMLEGNDSPAYTEIPSTIVFRSSCGCISSTIKQAYAEPAEKALPLSFEKVKLSIMNQLGELNQSLLFGNNTGLLDKLIKYESSILDAFLDEYEHNKNDQFIFAWKNLILWAIEKNLNYVFVSDILSNIRRSIIPHLSGDDRIVKAENIFHAARVYFLEAIQSSSSYGLNPLHSENSDFLGEDLMANLDYRNQMKSMCQALPRLGIDMCYIALFEDPESPLDKSRLILGLNNKACYNQGSSGIVFNTLDLLPDTFLQELYSDRFNIIVQALCQGDNRLGYVILSFDNGINKNYELIRYRLSVAIKGTLLIDRITKQAASLEKQVIRRTKELSESNKSLMEEIIKRKAVEEQLKQALKDLGYYNEQLHLQSIRDDLTQLYNRRGFMNLGTQCFNRAKENSHGLLLLYVDLDGLKSINDKYGHNEGDCAISSAAEVLVKAFRSTDIICRLGGDEFTIIMAGATHKDEVEIRSRIQKYCEKYNDSMSKPYKLSMSIGAAYFSPGSDLSFEDLMKLADAALYEDKKNKRRIHFNIWHDYS